MKMGIARSSWPQAAFLSIPHSWINSCNIDLDPAICSGGRRPRSTGGGGRRQRSAKGHDRRRPKAGVGACRASRARTRAEAPIQVRKGALRPALVRFAACIPQRRHIASQQRHAPCRRFCDLPKYPAALTNNRNRFLSPTSVQFSGHRSSSHFRALISAASSPETPIPPLSLPQP